MIFAHRVDIIAEDEVDNKLEFIEVKRLLFEKHIFTSGAGVSTVRLLPALGITKAQADVFLAAFKELI